MAPSSGERPILVTGAAGFIGAAVVRALQGEGHPVRAGQRRTKAQSGVAVACDLDDAASVANAVNGTGLVVHAAYGSVPDMAQQCRCLLAAMENAGVKNLIHLSSIAVYGDAEGAIGEDFSGAAQLDAYGQAKRDCEAAIRDWAGKDGRSALILRPGIVYGAGSLFWIDKMAERIRAGVWGTFGVSGEGTAALIHVDDLAAMIAAAATRMQAGGDKRLAGAPAINAVGPQTTSWNAYFQALAAALGAPPLKDMSPAEQKRRQKIAVAAKLWRRLGLPGGHAASLFAMPGEMALFGRKADYRSRRAADLLGFEPRIGLADGLKRSVPQART